MSERQRANEGPGAFAHAPDEPRPEPGDAERPDAPADVGERAGQARARRRPGMRDMLLSMLLLGVVVVILTMLTQVSLNPAGDSARSTYVPTVDVTGELQAAAGQLRFPLRQPHLPGDWRPNSASMDPLGTNNANHELRIGWIVPGGQFVQLSQSDANPLDLVRRAAEFGDDTPVDPVGHTTVAGTPWTIYPGVRSEQSWVADLGSVRLLITGNGTDAQFRTLATAVLNGRVVRTSGS